MLVVQPHLHPESGIQRWRNVSGPIHHRDNAVPSSGVAGALESPDTRCKAWRNIIGSVFPRLAARPSIPRQAVARKKYRRRTSPVSKMSDNEDAAAALGNSKVLSVKHPVGPPIPEF